MNNKQYRYNHLGIPTTKKLKNEKYWANFAIYTSGYEENEFHIEWMRYGAKCKLPHIAFEVDDINEAIKGHKISIEPNSPCPGIVVAFVLVNDAPIEFIQFAKRKLKKK